jgi:chorismate mutase/prephenate dehydratase
VYGLGKLVTDIEDRPDNTTRFFIIGRKLFPPSGEDKTTLLLSSSHTEDDGALHGLLAPLARHKVNMTRIESRPSRQRKWHYVFLIYGMPRTARWRQRRKKATCAIVPRPRSHPKAVLQAFRMNAARRIVRLAARGARAPALYPGKLSRN